MTHIRTEYGLRLDSGADAGDVIPIDDGRAERIKRPVKVNGKPATLMTRVITVGEWGAVDPPTQRESGHDLGDDPDGDADPWA